MIHNLYIISEGGIALYSKNFTKSTLDEQLISGFILAIENFTKEAVGSGLKKIEMQTGEQLFIYYDSSLNLTAAAITGAQDYPKLVAKTLQEILEKFKTKFGQLEQFKNIDDTTEFDSNLTRMMRERTASRTKMWFIFGLIIGSGLLLGIYALLWNEFFLSIKTYIIQILSTPADDYGAFIFIFGAFSLSLELKLIICFIPSAILGGYIAGSRNKGKWLGITLSSLMLLLSTLLTLFSFQNKDLLAFSFLFLFMLIIYIPLVLVTSITLSYLGGLIRDRRKLYPIPPEKILDKPEKN